MTQDDEVFGRESRCDFKRIHAYTPLRVLFPSHDSSSEQTLVLGLVLPGPGEIRE